MNRNFKTLATSLLAGCMLLVSVQAVSFPDVDANADYAEAIDYISKEGIIVGDSNGNFNPNQTVTRAQMAAIICRMLGETEGLEKKEDFPDVSTTHWANAYISKAVELGIVSGYKDGTFGPSTNVSYEQAVTMIVRAIGESENAQESGGYPDGFLFVARERGLLAGLSKEKGGPLSRSDVAVLLYNYYIPEFMRG